MPILWCENYFEFLRKAKGSEQKGRAREGPPVIPLAWGGKLEMGQKEEKRGLSQLNVCLLSWKETWKGQFTIRHAPPSMAADAYSWKPEPAGHSSRPFIGKRVRGSNDSECLLGRNGVRLRGFVYMANRGNQTVQLKEMAQQKKALNGKR